MTSNEPIDDSLSMDATAQAVIARAMREVDGRDDVARVVVVIELDNGGAMITSSGCESLADVVEALLDAQDRVIGAAMGEGGGCDDDDDEGEEWKLAE